MELHYKGNPYATGIPLKSTVSSALIPEHSKTDILTYPEKGQAAYELFVEKRYLSKLTNSMWDPMDELN